VEAELGWKPRINLEINLDWIVGWYSAWLKGESMREFTLSQIRNFQSI
jgi:hypothetical protein